MKGGGKGSKDRDKFKDRREKQKIRDESRERWRNYTTKNLHSKTSPTNAESSGMQSSG
jgi:hypothetical protein